MEQEDFSKYNGEGTTLRKAAVKVASNLGLYKWCVKIDTRFKEKKMAKAFHQFGLETLVEADKVVSSFGGKMFLAFGTLLGAYRNKNFIPYDCDIDVGLLATERPDNMTELMKKSGFCLKKQLYFKTSNTLIEEQYEFKGVGIDFFYYFQNENEEMFTYITQRHEFKDWREANKSDGFPAIKKICPTTSFSKQKFLDHSFYFPDKTVEWLSCLYGKNFMVPDPNWSMNDHKKFAQSVTDRVYRRQ